MYKMIVFDIDGTLMKFKVSAQQFDDKTKQMFKELKDNGYVVVLATGRDHISIGDLHKDNNIDYFIGANGSFIHDLRLGEDIWSTTLSIDDFEKYRENVLDENDDEVTNIILSDSQSLFVYSIDKIKDHWFWNNFTGTFKEFDLHRTNLKTDNFHLITINCNDDKLINLSKEFFDKTNSSLDIQASWDKGFFVSERNLNKAKTIRRLAEQLNLDTKQIVAFGDGENDIEMIQMAGLGIAMGNAIDKLKEIANDVADDVSVNGTYIKLKELGII
ncbi:MAG: YcsE-related riboflavin metabolism phosphatase [Metamycoplasmataceae bacterium]